MTTDKKLENIIERLLDQHSNCDDEMDKKFYETQIRKYALKYKEQTGHFYMRGITPEVRL